jgi:hypothetical protein
LSFHAELLSIAATGWNGRGASNLQSIEIRKLLRAPQTVNKMMTQIESELLSMESCESKTIGTECKSARFTFKKPPLIGCSHHYSIHLIRPINTLG